MTGGIAIFFNPQSEFSGGSQNRAVLRTAAKPDYGLLTVHYFRRGGAHFVDASPNVVQRLLKSSVLEGFVIFVLLGRSPGLGRLAGHGIPIAAIIQVVDPFVVFILFLHDDLEARIGPNAPFLGLLAVRKAV